MDVATNVCCSNERLGEERIFVFCLRVEVVYTSVERIQISPPKGNGSRANAGHCLFGAIGCDTLTAAQKGRNGGGPVPTVKQPFGNSSDRIRIGLPYQNRIITGRVDRQKDVG